MIEAVDTKIKNLIEQYHLRLLFNLNDSKIGIGFQRKNRIGAE
jgi:hypothetical protein